MGGKEGKRRKKMKERNEWEGRKEWQEGKERMKGRNEKGRKGRKEKIVLILLIFKLRVLFSLERNLYLQNCELLLGRSCICSSLPYFVQGENMYCGLHVECIVGMRKVLVGWPSAVLANQYPPKLLMETVEQISIPLARVFNLY